jgi:hypothetical protein
MKHLSISLMAVVLLSTGFVAAGAAIHKEPGVIPLKRAPSDVQQRILKEADGNAITQVKQVYEAHWLFDGNEVEILVGADGELLSKTVDSATDDDNAVDPNNFVATIDNQYFPLTPGTVFHYEGLTEGQPTTDDVNVTHDTNVIMGVTTTVVRDKVFINGILTEDTNDFYAQDNIGNVWYFGEDAKELDANGAVVSTEGSWKAGVNGALPGIVMEAFPHTGDKYQQEFATGVAQDMAAVLSLKAKATVTFGSFDHCLKTKEFSPLEPGVVEQKFYAPNVGFLKTVMVKGGSESLELVSITP